MSIYQSIMRRADRLINLEAKEEMIEGLKRVIKKSS